MTTGTTFRLPRTGNAPLVFEGELLARDDDRSGSTRWHEIEIYAARKVGAYVLRIRFCSPRCSLESEQSIATPCADARELRETLSAYDPTSFIVGFPAHMLAENAVMRGKVVDIKNDVRRRFEEMVTRVLSSRDEFAEML